MKRLVIACFCLTGMLLAAPLPGFRSGPSDEAPETIARNFLSADFSGNLNLVLLRQWTDVHNGLHHFTFEQQLFGLPVFGEQLCVHVTKKGEVVSCHGHLRALAEKPEHSLTAAQARAAAAAELNLPVGDDVAAKQVIFFPPDAAACVGWHLQVNAANGSAAWNICVDAMSGATLFKNDLVYRCAHLVYAPTLESADHGAQTLVDCIVDPLASPFGWHDADGVAGHEFTDTRGNNVHAQEDADADNIGGIRPNGGAELVFDFAYDPTAQSVTGNTEVATVNAFFWANYLHDVLYQYGFDEPSGNFQFNNYGRGGQANDQVLVDVQDGVSINNATFASPGDGSPGRMQLHRWVNSALTVSITEPDVLIGDISGSGAQFGGSVPVTGLSGEVVQALDAFAPYDSTTDACTVLTNAAAIAGKIAIIDRGECFFTEKVKAAQDAEAIAAIIVNNDGDSLVRMAGTDASISIPSVFLRQSQGEAIQEQLALGETVELTIFGSPERDAALDNGIIAHEYVHGLTSRLTGGPANPNCLFQRQSASLAEGWSDFFGMVLTQTTNDVRSTRRGVGAYVQGDIDGPGIRSIPYAADLAVNPLTFNDIEVLRNLHNVGEVWCLCLWELYWDFIETYGYDSDVLNGQGGNNLCLQLVVDALKIQACNPSFTQARDAILLADQVNYEGAFQCMIWRAFARRGLGRRADAGAVSDITVDEDFTVPLGCEIPLDMALDAPDASPYQISWPAISGAVYQVQASLDAVQPVWTNVPNGLVTAVLDNVSIDLPATGPTQQFYRVQLHLAP